MVDVLGGPRITALDAVLIPIQRGRVKMMPIVPLFQHSHSTDGAMFDAAIAELLQPVAAAVCAGSAVVLTSKFPLSLALHIRSRRMTHAMLCFSGLHADLQPSSPCMLCVKPVLAPELYKSIHTVFDWMQKTTIPLFLCIHPPI